jgi:hypothetical protein
MAFRGLFCGAAPEYFAFFQGFASHYSLLKTVFYFLCLPGSILAMF